MKPHHLFALICASHIGWAHAEIYKHTDSEGRVTYSSTPMRGAKKLDMTPPLTSPSSATRTRSETGHADFPRVDSMTQKNRDSMRNKILTDELAAEEKLLAEARKSLKDAEESQAASPGNANRNATGRDGKIRALHEQVSLHEKNVDALKIELSSRK